MHRALWEQGLGLQQRRSCAKALGQEAMAQSSRRTVGLQQGRDSADGLREPSRRSALAPAHSPSRAGS